MLTSSLLYNLVLGLYFSAMVTFIAYLATHSRLVSRLSIIISWAGLSTHTLAIALRWYESYQLPGNVGRAPLTNLYESVTFFAWTILLIYLLIDIKYRYRAMGAFILPFAFLSMAWAQLTLDSAVEPLVPALQSNWLTYHVVSCFLGYAAFAVGCGVSLMYLVRGHWEDRSNSSTGMMALFPSLKILDIINYKAVMIGFPLLTLGVISGAIWANYAWGTYWSWDPKETWSLIVWFIYAAFLHARLTRGWAGKKAALLSITGFGATIFCYLGVNLLLAGLHSYGS